ncbi:MAG: hypothetical protein KDK64_00030 [Chlamydiia bacterium]|nr:hypothetical protein [Chlamydiia bacterium]
MRKVFFILVFAFIGFGSYYVYNHLNVPSKKVGFHHVVKKGLGFEKWKTFAPDAENFSAAFPQKPKTVMRDLPVPGGEESLPYKEYICAVEGNKRFSISYTTLPAGWLKYGEGLVLGGALKVIMKELGKVELVGKEKTVFKSFPALDYEHYDQTTETAGVLVLVGNVLYKVEMTYPLELHDKVQDELENFIANFNPTIAASTQTESLEADTTQSQ